jgi:transmembrane sensor
VLGAGAGLAAGVAGLVAVGVWSFNRRQAYSTKKGELRQVVLPDGTVATLNTASLISVKFSRGRRDVSLAGGEVLFDVAKDASRPFYVSAGSTQVRVVGTSFSVTRLKDRPVQVLVREGIVEVSRFGAGPAASVRLVANTRAVDAGAVVADPSTHFSIDKVADPELRRQLAWRGGRIEFDGQTLQDAAAEFARYSDVRIVVADPALAREEIAGLYQCTDPVGFAQAVAASLDARAEVVDGQVRITR